MEIGGCPRFLSAKAQWEIRKACAKMLAILKQHAPACFEDITPDGV